MDEALLRSLTPSVLGILVRRGADFAAAEDAVQDALVEAVRVWPDDPPRDPKGWLVTVAWRRFLDATRVDAARRRREELVEERAGARARRAGLDDTLQLYFLCAHPSLTPSSAVALTLRAVGGLTTRQIAAGLPGARGDDGAAHQPGQAHGLRRAVRPARRRRHRAARPLPGLQRGVLRRRRPRRRGHPAHPAARRRDRSSRGGGAARPDAAAPRAAAARTARRRQPGSARRAGPRPVGHRGRSPRASRSCRRPSPATGWASSRPRPRSPPCTPTRRAPRRPTGCRSSSGTTNCCG